MIFGYSGTVKQDGVAVTLWNYLLMVFGLTLRHQRLSWDSCWFYALPSGKCWCSRVQLKRDGTRWGTGGEMKGKLANGVGSQYPSLPRNLVYPALLPLMRTPRLPVVDWTDAPADLRGLVRFAERQNLFSARVPSHFKRGLVSQPFRFLACFIHLVSYCGSCLQ